MLCPNSISRKLNNKIYKEKHFLSKDKQSQKHAPKKGLFNIKCSKAKENQENLYFRNQSAEYFGPNVVENPINWQNLKEKHYCRL